MTAALLLTIKLAVATLIFAIGLSATLADLTYLWRRPLQLLRALVAMYVMIPLITLLAMSAVELPGAVEIAMLVLAVSAGAPLLPRKLMKLGHESYMLSLVVSSSAVAVVAVPLWLEVLRPLYGPGGMRKNSLVGLLPSAIGRGCSRNLGPRSRHLIADVGGIEGVEGRRCRVVHDGPSGCCRVFPSP